jgi:hypothetical protein
MGRLPVARAGAPAAVLGGALAFYLWTVATSRQDLRFTPQPGGYHHFQAAGFLAGRLSLLLAPKPELLALPDPYDPERNQPYRKHDLTLFRGQYYMYWGPGPALLWFAPLRALTGVYFPESLAAALFAFGGAALSSLMLLRLQQRYLPQTPLGMVLAGVAALCLCNVAPFLLRRATTYEVAILAAYFLTQAALYVLYSGGLAEPPAPWRCLAAGTLVGLAASARINAVTGAAFLALAAWPAARRRRRALLCLFGPLAVCVGLLGFYNRQRFGSWTELGFTHQLTSDRIANRPLFSPGHIPYGLYFYLLAPCRWTPDFPFLQVTGDTTLRLPRYFTVEPVAGILSNVPFVNLLWVLPWYFGRLRRQTPGLAPVMAGMLAGGLASLAVVSGVLSWATMRYETDFLPLLAAPALLLWWWLEQHFARDKVGRWSLRALLGPLLAYSLLYQAAIGLVGYDDSLRRAHPAAWAAVRRPFVPLERVLAGGRYGPLEVVVQFGASPSLQPEPLVVTGAPNAGDLAMVRHLEPGVVQFGFDHWGAPVVWSEPQRIDPARAYTLELHLGSLYPAQPSLFGLWWPEGEWERRRKRLAVKLDGRLLLERQAEFHPSQPEQVTVGENRIGGACGPRFTGIIVATRPVRN